MFYSHQLLARKAPLGQIWMAATMHAKINRRKLYKIDIISICEEILNPSVPMALRLSGILMGGVVIVYQRKVKLLYDDVSRLLLEINEAWKVKAVADPTVLPKGKTQAKYEAVTLQENGEMEVGDIEQSLRFSIPTATTGFHNTDNFHMGLDDVGEAYVNIDPRDDDLNQQHHQADAANITLFDHFDSCQAETTLYNRFERFDIDGDEELNFTPQEYPQVPTTLVPSPPPHEESRQADEIQYPHDKPQDEQHNDESREKAQETEQIKRRRPIKRKAGPKSARVIMDNDLTIIPGQIYQAWLHDTSDIFSRSDRRMKKFNPFLSKKTSSLMELPPVAIVSGLESVTGEAHFPAPLLEQWRKCMVAEPSHNSPSVGSSPPQPPGPSSSSSLDHRNDAHNPREFPVEDFQSVIGPQQQQFSIEKLRANFENIEQIAVKDALKMDQLVTPGSSARNPSSGSGDEFLQMDPEIQLPSGRSKRRQGSSSRHSFGSLDPVEEDIPWKENGRDPKLRRLSEDVATPDLELLVETVPTQTPPLMKSPAMSEITHSIRTHLKSHFDTPGNPQVESLNHLAFGMSRSKAAQLFYQTCVLASSNYVRVEQKVAYGEISISRGPRM